MIGSARGVWAFENRKHTRRGFGKPLLGSFLGAVVDVGVGVSAASGGWGFLMGVALPPIGALAGYLHRGSALANGVLFLGGPGGTLSRPLMEVAA